MSIRINVCTHMLPNVSAECVLIREAERNKCVNANRIPVELSGFDTYIVYCDTRCKMKIEHSNFQTEDYRMYEQLIRSNRNYYIIYHYTIDYRQLCLFVYFSLFIYSTLRSRTLTRSTTQEHLKWSELHEHVCTNQSINRSNQNEIHCCIWLLLFYAMGNCVSQLRLPCLELRRSVRFAEF